MPSNGADRRMRTGLRYPGRIHVSSCNKAAPLGESGGMGLVAGVTVLDMALRHKVVWIEVWTLANFCNVRMRRKCSIACSPRRNGRCELTGHLAVACCLVRAWSTGRCADGRCRAQGWGESAGHWAPGGWFFAGQAGGKPCPAFGPLRGRASGGVVWLRE
jgi:hypothetical protein